MDILIPPLALYVHLPWCVRKCPYCDFNSYEAKGALAEDAYVDALLRDLDAELPAARGRELASVFVGGGTPSLFSGAAIRRLLDGVRGRVRLAADAEITLEANPGAVDAAHFAAYREAGVTRLSIGVQSFRAEQLRRLGRVHDAAAARAAVRTAREAGFDNVNLDLMYGLPEDSHEGAFSDLQAAIDLQPAHLSWYQLTLEPNTAFHRRPPELPEEDVVLEIEARGRELLARSGYERYEVSAYARSGRRCVHNLNYWRFGDYLGIGAGAHGKVTLAAQRAIERRAKQRNPRTYVDAAGTPAAVAVERIDTPRAIAIECLMNVLRLPEGIGAAELEARTGEPWTALAEPVAAGVRRGWLAPDAGVVRTTPAGLQMLNALLALF
jgi:oxygen-independent coproporphyrinogen-3 oxidase